MGPGEGQAVELLARLLELGRPGSTDRGRRLAASALQLASRFEVPHVFLHDLELAARLHEIGMLVEWPGRRDILASDPDVWRYTVASASILREMQALVETASLIHALRENWDGSGAPGHLQRGQIPFRSRLLRVLIDFYDQLNRAALAGQPMDASTAAERLATHATTWYDPVVVSQLQAMVGGSPELAEPATKVVLPVSELHEGMVLAEDLCTSGGIKLLARGTTVTSRALETILKRHEIDPILAGAWVERSVRG